jgi:hypothetical protein
MPPPKELRALLDWVYMGRGLYLSTEQPLKQPL